MESYRDWPLGQTLDMPDVGGSEAVSTYAPSMSHTTESSLEEMAAKDSGTTVACVILGLCFLLGVPGNLLVIWTILRHVKRRSHTVLLILHLAAADLLILITLPLWIYSLAHSWVFGETSCKALVYIIYACMYSSVFLITLMSVERFVAVRYPFASANWRKKKALNKVLLVLWTAAFLFSIPVIPTQFASQDECLYRSFSSATQELVCLLLETLVGYVLPFSILVVCYSYLCSRITQMTFKTKRKSTVLIASVVVVFAVCWTPHHIGNVLSLVSLAMEHSFPDTARSLTEVGSTMVYIAGAMVFISSTLNPILFMFAARSFRSSLDDTGIKKLFRHISGTSPDTAVSTYAPSMSHTTESSLEEMAAKDSGTTVACVILGLCFLLGVPGNLLVIWTILRHVKRRSHTVLLILHLAAADLLVLITLPLWIYSLAHSWVFGETSCKALVYIIYACMYSSVFLITLMSVERFVAVRYPFASADWRKKKALNKVLLVLWTAAFLFSIPVIPTQFVGDFNGKDQCLDRIYSSATQELVCLLLETLVGYVLPFSILVVCYGCLCSRITQMTFKSKRKSTVLIASVVVVFAVCWTPHHIGNVLSLVSLAMEHSFPDTAGSLEDVSSTMVFIAGAMVFISSTLNPILYMFAARSFRSSLGDTGIKKLFRHISSTSPGEGNRELSFVSKRQNNQTSSSQCVTESNGYINEYVWK